MKAQEYHMTQAAYDELVEELKHKQEVEKPALAKRLKAAIELGDLSENADYQTAKEDQGFLQGRIDKLEEIIRGAVIIQEGSQDGIIAIGSKVTVKEVGEDETEAFMIVGKVEANPREGKISDESPLGRALLGHKKGDKVKYSAPAGDIAFKITDVS